MIKAHKIMSFDHVEEVIVIAQLTTLRLLIGPFGIKNSKAFGRAGFSTKKAYCARHILECVFFFRYNTGRRVEKELRDGRVEKELRDVCDGYPA
jgi:hypothetical protein